MASATTKELKEIVEKHNKLLLSQNIMKEDCWYLVPEATIQAFSVMRWNRSDTKRLSVIVHDCPVWEQPKQAKRKVDFVPLGYWDCMEAMELECAICGELPPQNLITCWVLMNTEFLSTE